MSSFDDYMNRLPNGLDSYPECQLKAAFMLGKFTDCPVEVDRSKLPSRLLYWLDHPPPSSVFVPTVEMFALNHALVDAFDDEKAFLDYTIDLNRKRLESVLYRALFLFVSPKSLVKNAHQRWSKIHKGITMSATMTGPNTCSAVIEYPPHLATPILVEIWSEVFGIALDLTGANNARNTSVDYTPTRATFSGAWD